jgi:outer membrane protein assembly factor BamB
MQRNLTGGTSTENDSTYQIIIRRIDKDAPEWRTDTIGPPRYFPLQTVDVVAGNRNIIVLDKNNKELWKADLTFLIRGGSFGFLDDEEEGATEMGGQSSCVEHDGGLYVYDEGMLTAFDLNSGNVRWRVPSVGIYGMRFNDDGMLYVSTTSAGPDTIKYPQQIDLGSKVEDVLMKIDPKSGKIIWSVAPGGRVAYISGKYIYTLSSFTPMENDRHPYEKTTGFEPDPYTNIRRVDPKTGKMLWEYVEKRGPLDVEFNKNTVEAVFKKEVQVLKYMTF